LFKAGEGKLLKMHANVFPYLAIFFTGYIQQFRAGNLGNWQKDARLRLNQEGIL